MKKVHLLKLSEYFADEVYDGTKNFEVRYNDRGFQKGDEVCFKVVGAEHPTDIIPHPLNGMAFEITYVLSGWGIQEGYVVFGIKKVGR